MAFADEHGGPIIGNLEVEIDGEASMVFGYDLQERSMGFTNSSESSITIEMVPEASSEKGEGDIYGWIELADFAITIAGDGGHTVENTDGDEVVTYLTVTVPAVSAKIIKDPIWIKVFDQDGMATGKVEPVEDDDYEVEDDELADDIGPDFDTSGGISVGADTEMIDVAVHFASEGDYDADDGVGTGMAVGLDATVVAGPATIGAELVKAFGYDSSDDDTLGAGLSVDLDVGTGDISIEPSVSVDIQKTGVSGSNLELEVGFGLDVGLDADSNTAIGIDGVYSDVLFTDLEVTFSDNASGMIPGLALDLLFGLYDLGTTTSGDTSDWRLDVDVSYEVALDTGTLTPAVGFDFNSVSTMGLEISVTIDDMFPYTSFELKYAADSLSDASGSGGSAQDLGLVTVTTTVSY